MIRYRKMTKAQAREFVESIDELSDLAFENQVAQWISQDVSDYDESYESLRKMVLEAYNSSIEQGAYMIDLNVGIALYTQMNADTGFTTVMANDDDIWRYLSCKVFPDITYLRYPKAGTGDIRLNSKRFYQHTRRIWIKTLWWYIHLSWQGTEKRTYRVLKDLGSDTISDFIERTGKGYRLALYREFMKQYAGIKKKSSDLFNQLQKQNLVNCKNVEPALTENGEAGYVERLLQQLKVGE